MPKPTIFLDMDEVLVDWIGGMLRAHGLTRQYLQSVWKAGVWDMARVLGIPNHQMWIPIHRLGEQFWVDLEPTPWADRMIAMVSSFSDDWYIVSSPSSGNCTSYSGKKRWLNNRFGSSFNRLVLTNHKSRVLSTHGILIDDNEATCDEFERRGGTAVVFPTNGNSLHELSGNPVLYVRNYLVSIGFRSNPNRKEQTHGNDSA